MSLTQHWKCDDNAASTTVVATVGTNATLQGGANTSARTVAGPGGSITAGLSLNGTADFIDITASSVSFAAGTAFSASIWFKRAGTIARLLGDATASQNRILGNPDTTIILVDSTGTTRNFTVPAMGTTNWHHLLVTRTTGDSCRVFLDGTESSTGAITLTMNLSANAIGKSGNLFSSGFSVAQIKIFDSDESANVATLYAEGTGGGGGGRVTKNTRPAPLGIETGMGFGMSG